MSYSTMLREHIADRTGVSLDAAAIRQHSAMAVTRDDVTHVDERLIDEVSAIRNSHDIIVDSHPVTKESFGFRVTPFTAEQLVALDPDAIACLYASPDVLYQRMSVDPGGRQPSSLLELELHVQLQCAVSAQYSVATGKSCYLFNTEMQIEVLAQRVAETLRLSAH
jgi:adenylate kinase